MKPRQAFHHPTLFAAITTFILPHDSPSGALFSGRGTSLSVLDMASTAHTPAHPAHALPPSLSLPLNHPSAPPSRRRQFHAPIWIDIRHVKIAELQKHTEQKRVQHYTTKSHRKSSMRKRPSDRRAIPIPLRPRRRPQAQHPVVRHNQYLVPPHALRLPRRRRWGIVRARPSIPIIIPHPTIHMSHIEQRRSLRLTQDTLRSSACFRPYS